MKRELQLPCGEKAGMTVEVIQYTRPHGKTRRLVGFIDASLRAQYEDMIAKGFRFSAEILFDSPATVSLCIENDEEDVDCKIEKNGPGLNSALEAMLRAEKWNRADESTTTQEELE